MDVEVREDRHDESIMLNMGPQHPATHGVLRLILELDGEVILKAEPVIGYLHRGKEKHGETLTLHQNIPYTDRMDYLAPLANNVAYALACEKLIDVECPPRAQVIRVIAVELARISSHLLGLGAYAMDVGAMTVFLWAFREREAIYSLIERISSARFTTSYTRIGGVAHDLPEDFWPKLEKFCREFPKRVDEYEKMLTRNKIWIRRTQGVGVITREQALAYGLTGPNLRATGVDYDLRKAHPYLTYADYDFEVPIGTVGDCYDRYLVRIEEMRQSTRILDQARQSIPDGPILNREGDNQLKSVFPEKKKVLTNMESLIHQFMVFTDSVDLPSGEIHFSHENPKGELAFFIRGEGGTTARRLRLRGPSFATIQIMSEMLPGHMIADVMAIIGSVDFVMGECDR
jgi:NADH-quinone oxidoreductase subunit D